MREKSSKVGTVGRIKKLVLSKETLRELTAPELRGVAGGVPRDTGPTCGATCGISGRRCG